MFLLPKIYKLQLLIISMVKQQKNEILTTTEKCLFSFGAIVFYVFLLLTATDIILSYYLDEPVITQIITGIIAYCSAGVLSIILGLITYERFTRALVGIRDAHDTLKKMSR